jgi:hypothetical protein
LKSRIRIRNKKFQIHNRYIVLTEQLRLQLQKGKMQQLWLLLRLLSSGLYGTAKFNRKFIICFATLAPDLAKLCGTLMIQCRLGNTCFRFVDLMHDMATQGGISVSQPFVNYFFFLPGMQAEQFCPLQTAHAWGQARQVLTARAGRVRGGHTSTHVEMCSRWSG